ncbi:MAG TPA: Ig-like domain-containing protein [Candidatus Caccocola faecigallinarum]|nr:Ig-like domain-containing protein [Candidatus Caccocola faecigallinarum]
MFSVFGMKYKVRAYERRLFLSFLAAALFIAAFTVSPSAALTRDTDGAYLIATSADLTEFRRAVNAGSADICARLTADIDLSAKGEPSPWTPIGNPVYCGTFDGGGHTVSGYVVTKAAQEESAYGTMYYSGFFAKVGEDGYTAQIKNLILRGDVSVSADNYLRVGGLAGLVSENTDTATASISNCVHIGSVYGETANNTASVGGLVGYNDGIVSDSFHSGDVFTSAEKIQSAKLGGLAGQNSKALNIVNCCWQKGNGFGENYASAGVSDGGAVITELSSDIVKLSVVTTISASADITDLSTTGRAIVSLSPAPGLPQHVGDYILNPQVVEDSYDHDIIEVTNNNDRTFSVTPLAAGETPVTFTAELRPTDFSSEPPYFAPVSEADAKQMSMTIEISVSEAPPLPDIRVEPPSADMTVGERLALVAVAANGEAFDDFVTWSSGDESVVIVDADGMAAAVSKGSAAVTASTEDGRSAVCSIKVSEAPEVPDEPVISPVSPDVPPAPEDDAPPGVPPSSGGGCSAGFGFPAAAALAFLFLALSQQMVDFDEK